MSFQIGTKIGTNEPFSLDIKAVISSRTYIASMTRYGKSWTCRKIIEEVFGHCGIVIIDPEGEYSSLREKYPFLIIGVDVPIQIETAELMAEQVLKNDVSVILDTSKERDDKEYVRKFLDQFFYLETTARKPYLLVVEESEDYGPEKGAPGTAECLPILIAYAKKGGKRGIGCIFVGHRPAWISKGILSQCSNKALGKIESTDFKALETYARVPESIIEKLPGFAPGEFCFVGDWVKEVSFVKVGNVKTTHLGMSPEIVPPSPKALASVIENLQKSISKVVESVKPKVESVTEAEERIKKKYEERIAAIEKTADEKAERKYQVKIEALNKQLGDASRTLTLQAQEPISDVLEHPIVKARMAQLDQRAKDVLVKIEREPGLTREQLAAFLSASTNIVTNVVDQVNRTFKAQVVIDDGGRPLKYKSMLKRLYLTDVGRREIDELNRLHQANQEKDQAINTLKNENEQRKNNERTLASTVQEQKTRLDDLTRVLSDSQKAQEKISAQLSQAMGENENLNSEVKRLKQLSKIGEALDSVIKDYMSQSHPQANTPNNTPESGDLKSRIINLKENVGLLEKKVEGLAIAKAAGGGPGPEINVSVEQPILNVKTPQKSLDLDASTPLGRMAICYGEGLLPSEWVSSGKFMLALENRFGSKESPNGVSKALTDLVFFRFLDKRMKGTVAEYHVKVPPNEAKEKGWIKEAT